MFKKHITREGKECIVAEMSDTHLVNFINFVITNTKRVKKSNDPFQDSLYGRKALSDKEAGEIIRECIEELYPYLVEAYLRGLKKPQELLRQLIQRESALPGREEDTRLYLPAEIIDDDFDSILNA